MNDLININTDSYADLAKAMGIATEVSAKPKKSGNLNRLRIWHSPMMGQTEVNGKMIKVVSWYDNEAGYSARIADLAGIIASKLA